MASGANVSTNAIDAINEMRLSKDNEEKLRILRFGFCEVNDAKSCKKETQIDVVSRITQKELDEMQEDAFSYMTKKIFLDCNCAYVLYDCKYDTKETGSKAEMVFLMWCPGTAKISDKMCFASSKDALKNKMHGVKRLLEVCDRTDIVNKRAFVELMGRCDITALEGEKI